jgi:hypothetical protein
MGLALPTHRWHLSANREDASVFYDGREIAQCYTRTQARAIAIRANRADELDRIAWLLHPDVIVAFDRLIQARLALAGNPTGVDCDAFRIIPANALDEYHNAWAIAMQVYADRRAQALGVATNGATNGADPGPSATADLAQAMQAECIRLLALVVGAQPADQSEAADQPTSSDAG